MSITCLVCGAGMTMEMKECRFCVERLITQKALTDIAALLKKERMRVHRYFNIHVDLGQVHAVGGLEKDPIVGYYWIAWIKMRDKPLSIQAVDPYGHDRFDKGVNEKEYARFIREWTDE